MKAAIDDEFGYQYLGVISLTDFMSPETLDTFLNSAVPDAIYISSVTSPEILNTVKSTLQSIYQLFPVLLTAQKECCQLISGYDDFNELGSDRWMALQGARSLTHQPTIVIDAGTAMTIDAILEGRHLGGFIVPGLSSLRASLGADAANITVVDEHSASSGDSADSAPGTTLLATNTRSAILGGSLYMTASFIDSIVADLSNQIKTRFKVYITGGNAPKLSVLVNTPTEYIPDLVLLGMKKIVESVKK
jgi:type III pantothenate kinase